MVTQQQIINVIKNNDAKGITQQDREMIEIHFQQLNGSHNYENRFKKTYHYWSNENWKEVAQDIQKLMKFYANEK